MAKTSQQRREEEVICVCRVCGYARDDIAANRAWHSLSTHLSKYKFPREGLIYSHTFCPTCFTNYAQMLGLIPKRNLRLN
jgi:hypothetical protein